MAEKTLGTKRLGRVPLNERYEIAVFMFLTLQLIVMAADKNLDLWVMTPYLITYRFGLLPRALAGSVLSLFTDKVTTGIIFSIAIAFFLVLAAQISLLFAKAIRSSDEDLKLPVKLFTLLFLASPLSVTYLLGGYIARFDLFWLILTLVSLVFLKNRWLRWAVPLLSAAAIMIHQGYMVTYMPALVVPMLYEVYRSKYSKRSIAILALSCFLMGFVFIFLIFAQKNIPFADAAAFTESIAKNAGFQPEYHMVYSEYYCPFPNWTTNVVLPILAEIAVPVGLTLLMFSIPLIVIFFSVWKYAYKAAGNKFLKSVFIACAAAPLVFIPASVFATDLDRWWAAVINTQFIIVFYLIASKEKALTEAVKRTGNYLKEHLLLFAFIVITTNSLTFSKAAALVLTLAFRDIDKFQAILSYSG